MGAVDSDQRVGCGRAPGNHVGNKVFKDMVEGGKGVMNG